MLFIKDLVKSFADPSGGRVTIVDVPEFKLGDADQAVLLGRSGCGKTTLLHMIAGVVSPNEGEVWLDGVDVARLSEARRDMMRAEKVGYVFQTFNLLPGFSALENVLLAMTFARGRSDVRRAHDLLARVGMSHRLRYRPTALSVGEQQRVAVARALANKPRLLLADEPTSSLDAKNQELIIDLMRSSCREDGVALLMVTHDRELASQFERVERLDEINRAGAVA